MVEAPVVTLIVTTGDASGVTGVAWSGAAGAAGTAGVIGTPGARANKSGGYDGGGGGGDARDASSLVCVDGHARSCPDVARFFHTSGGAWKRMRRESVRLAT